MALGKSVCVGLLVVLVACGSTDEHLRRQGTESKRSDIELEASTEELYFELVRLHSVGLVDSERMAALQDNLDWVGAHYGGTADHEEQERQLLASTLWRTLSELRREQDPVVVGSEGRAYARRLHHAGVRESRRYAEGTLLIAGMLGVPTSGEDLVLMVAIPVGGFVVVKVGGMALKRTAFMLRRLRSVDDVVDRAKALGLRPRYAASEAELRRVAPTGRVIVFDPQSMEHMSYQQLLKRYGKARPHLLEAP